jgi:hypothetical protein
MNGIKNAAVARKDYIIKRLIKFGFTKMQDGRQLYDLPLSDLEHLHIEMMCKRAKRLERIVHIYECEDCVLTFAVEQAFEDQSIIKCPSCSDENIRDVCSGVLINH